jgi:hypothetical protein
MQKFEQPIPKSVVVDRTGETDLHSSFDARRQAFRALTEEGCFVMPNPGTSAQRAIFSTWVFRRWRRPALDSRFHKGYRIQTRSSLASKAWLISPRLPPRVLVCVPTFQTINELIAFT